MSTPHPPELVVPVVGIITRPPAPNGLEEMLAALLGPCVLRSPPSPFDATRYYEAEMGPGLERRFLAWAPRRAGDLAALKRATIDLEVRWSTGGARRANLDPGQVTLGGFFLASCKPAPHRVHLSGGIYAELTLWFRHGWTALPWTFPDLRDGRHFAFLDDCRALLKATARADHQGAGPGGSPPPGP